MSSERITLQVGGLTLEAVLHAAEHARGTLVPAAAVCHPHPLYGGDMQNNVVVALCNALSAHGIAALRFNFRGVGHSQGSHGGGREERDDVRSALAFLASRPDIDARGLCLAGYSFGALVALSGRYPGLAAIAAVSPPLSGNPSDAIALEYPALFVFGGKDRIAPASALERSGLRLPPGSRVAVIPEADHFWWGHEAEAAQEVVAFFEELTRSPGGSIRDGVPRLG